VAKYNRILKAWQNRAKVCRCGRNMAKVCRYGRKQQNTAKSKRIKRKATALISLWAIRLQTIMQTTMYMFTLPAPQAVGPHPT